VSLLESLFDALNRANVRYVVVGGVATVLHGFARLTADVDLAVDLAPVEARKAIETLVGLGLRPRPPVDPASFADPAIRSSWVRDKGMRVFSLWDPTNPMREVDLFVEHPLAFEGLFARAEIIPLDTTTVRIASIPDLITLKRQAGRPQDLTDIEALEAILQTRKPSDG
jgi:predicted nucleotidyltransferase